MLIEEIIEGYRVSLDGGELGIIAGGRRQEENPDDRSIVAIQLVLIFKRSAIPAASRGAGRNSPIDN